MDNNQVYGGASTAEIIAHYVRNDHLKRGQESALRAWQLQPELPEPGELMAADPPPLPHDSQTKAGYLERQYLMSRFEGTELLRRAVNNFRQTPKMKEESDFFIYTQVRLAFSPFRLIVSDLCHKVHVQGYMFSAAGPACRISFSTERSHTKVVWSKSARLTAGTLVALSPTTDNFRQQCFVAVVAARYLLGGLEPNRDAGEDENTPPRIEIFWSNCQDAILDPSAELVMIEAKGGYFETVRHSMVGLQHAALFQSKFDKYLLNGCTQDPMAAYIQEARGQTAYEPTNAKSFDASQMEAFKRMTSRELAVIQGPPGTGKTFTSVVALESHVRTLQAAYGKHEAFPPVVVAAQTNHALDQILNRCAEFKAVIARLGGRTEDEAIKPRTLFNIKKNSKLSRGPLRGQSNRKAALKAIKGVLSACFPQGLISAEEFYGEGLITKEQFDSFDDDEWESAELVGGNTDTSLNAMVQWLDGCIEADHTYVYRPPTNQADAPVLDDGDLDQADRQEEDEKEKLQGEYIAIKFHYTGTVPGTVSAESAWYHQAQRLLAKHSNLYLIKPPQRGMVYRYLRKRFVDKKAARFPQLLREYRAACDEIKISNWDKSVKILRNERIELLGCTTTGLTKYHGLIAALKPRILMIEEAAETREASITSALYPSLDQVVLVGDHQQLVPHVDVWELGQEPYNMNVSLFERLVKLNLPYSMLRTQRRMVPAVREVVNTFYPRLEDHHTVYDPRIRPPIPGMGERSLFWFNHGWPEVQNVNDFSYSNPNEAEIISRFVRYLVQNGTQPSEITLLTYYKGQVSQLFEMLRRDPVLSNLNPTKKWSVRTVDSFQGEENNVIILSLVRSNRPGFMSNENRAVVATSRAKCGMFIFGDAMNLVDGRSERSYETWSKVYDVFVLNDCIGYTLPVTCQKHNRVTEIGDIHGWNTIPGGGCDQKCDEKCSQNHACETTCHPVDQASMKCRKACEKTLECGHRCGSSCGDPCKCPKRCKRPTMAKLPLRGPQLSVPPRRGKAKRGGIVQGSGPSQREFTLHIDDYDAEPTSEDLMAMGYFAHISQSRQYKEKKAHRVVVPNLESGPIPLTEDSVSAKWSPEKIQRKDLELLEVSRRKQPSPCPMVVQETYRETKMGVDGSRLYAPPLYSQFTIPAPSSEVSNTPSEQLSRKHQLLDAAAGFFPGDKYYGVVGEKDDLMNFD
ncbi:hypothetical protein FDECE_11397 [Fusarium decemcellulare]|nr:hypothetical protein FDECE_11397 [Fusarium decemcellulare]